MTERSFSFLFNELNEDSQPTVLAEDSIILEEVEPEKILRRLPYHENRFIKPTPDQPTLAGIHITQKNAVGFTLKFSDMNFYTMTTVKFMKDSKMLICWCPKLTRCRTRNSFHHVKFINIEMFYILPSFIYVFFKLFP